MPHDLQQRPVRPDHGRRSAALHSLLRGLALALLLSVGCANNVPGSTGRTDARTDTRAAIDGGEVDPRDGGPDGVDAGDAARVDTGPDAGPPAPCGEDGELCCEGDSCSGILVCSASICTTCGRPGEPCCSGGGCNTGLECSGGTCLGCGATGEACCAGSPRCEGGNTCAGSICRACGVEPGTCLPGTMETQACGRCGIQTRVCQASCEFAAWSGCSGENVCMAGQVESTPCGMCGSQSRTCNASCTWDPVSMCSGEGSCTSGETVTGGCAGPCQARRCNSACMPQACSETNPSCSAHAAACGVPCPVGYHVTRAACDTSCPQGCTTGSFVNRATECSPDAGASFRACVICNSTDGCANACGPGYYVAQIVSASAAERSACGLTDASMFVCRKTTTSFSQCGTTCPSGYTRIGSPTRSATTCSAAVIEANFNIPNGYAMLARCDGPGSL